MSTNVIKWKLMLTNDKEFRPIIRNFSQHFQILTNINILVPDIASHCSYRWSAGVKALPKRYFTSILSPYNDLLLPNITAPYRAGLARQHLTSGCNYIMSIRQTWYIQIITLSDQNTYFLGTINTMNNDYKISLFIILAPIVGYRFLYRLHNRYFQFSDQILSSTNHHPSCWG